MLCSSAQAEEEMSFTIGAADDDVDDKLKVETEASLFNADISAPVAKERTIKRGRGRPPKPKAEPKAEEPDPLEPAEGLEDSPLPAPGEKGRLIRIIQELKKKLGAIGSGLEPTLQNTVEELQEEVDILNNDLNSKRGDQAIKTLILYAMPLIETVIERMVDKNKLDVSSKYHLSDEVKNNWAMFEDAATQIAIMHASWFAVGPYGEIAKATAACAISADAKNRAERQRFAAAHAKAAQAEVSSATSQMP
jgi:hypothetical protein